MSERSEIQWATVETAGEKPLGALADKGFSPAPAPCEPAERDPEAVATARRRTFTAEYKLGILRQAEACTAPSERGAILRREGLYASHLTEWRRARDAGSLAGLAPGKRGPKVAGVDSHEAEVKQLRRDNARLQARLERAETIIDIQKKVATLLGIPLQSPNLEGKC